MGSQTSYLWPNYKGIKSTASAAVSMAASAWLPITGTIEITAPVIRIGTVTTLVKKQPDNNDDITNTINILSIYVFQLRPQFKCLLIAESSTHD